MNLVNGIEFVIMIAGGLAFLWILKMVLSSARKSPPLSKTPEFTRADKIGASIFSLGCLFTPVWGLSIGAAVILEKLGVPSWISWIFPITLGLLLSISLTRQYLRSIAPNYKGESRH